MQTSYLRQWAESRGKKQTQFPPEVTSPVTIYPIFTDKLTGNQIAVRCVLQGCFWNDDSISVFQKTGVQTTNSVSLYVPYAKEVTGRQYISPDEWNNLPFGSTEPIENFPKVWTINRVAPFPFMVKGESDFRFVWAAPNSANSVARQENNFRASNANVRQIRDVNEELFGTPDMWHIAIRA